MFFVVDERRSPIIRECPAHMIGEAECEKFSEPRHQHDEIQAGVRAVLLPNHHDQT